MCRKFSIICRYPRRLEIVEVLTLNVKMKTQALTSKEAYKASVGEDGNEEGSRSAL